MITFFTIRNAIKWQGNARILDNTARAARVLTDANIAVYRVDARGILGSAENAAGDYTDPPPPEFAGEGNEHLPSRAAPANLGLLFSGAGVGC